MCDVTRDAILNIRMRSALKALIEEDAKIEGTTASAVARKILASHYERQARRL